MHKRKVDYNFISTRSLPKHTVSLLDPGKRSAGGKATPGTTAVCGASGELGRMSKSH